MKLVFKNQALLVAAICYASLLLPGLASANQPVKPKPKQEQPTPTQPEPVQDAQEFTKTIKKEFSLNANGTVNLVNKYGKIDVKTWDKSRAKIEVTIVVKAGSESHAQVVFERIRIDFSNDDSFVKAETIIESNKSSWFDWGSSDRTEFQITQGLADLREVDAVGVFLLV